jgi:type 1 glutamine amidotransferase
MFKNWIVNLSLISTIVSLGLPQATQAENAAEPVKTIYFVAGTKSHGYGAHEHYAGSVLLAKAIEAGMPGYKTVVYRNGWPEAEDAFKNADAVVMYADGGGRHPVNPHLGQMDQMAEKGVGVVLLHYGVETVKGDAGDHFLKWIGGYFETDWSVNPHWTATFAKLPDHPITNGVKPFAMNDEWYYHMRFREGMENVTPILSDLPPKETLSRRDGPHSNNPHVRQAVLERQEPQHVAWASDHNGTRGFGFTGGHFHWNWGNPNFRKVVLNAIVWTAKGEVPEQGVGAEPMTVKSLQENQDYEVPKKFDAKKIQEQLKLPASKK